MGVVDFHVHLPYQLMYPDYFLNSFLDKFETNQTHKSMQLRMIRTRLNDYDGEMLINNMDAAGIDRAVLLVPDLFFYTGCDEYGAELRRIHEHHLSIKEKHGDRFVLFAGVDPRRGNDGIRILESFFNKGFCGLKLYPPTGFDIGDDSVLPYYALCERLRLPILLHIGPSLAGMRTTFDFPAALDRVATAYSNVTFVLGHAGILFLDQSMQLAIQHSNVYLDISGFQKLYGQRDVLCKKFMKLLSNVGHKALFGTDWPIYSHLNDIQRDVDQVKEICSDLNIATDLLFHQNANSILPLY